MSAASASALDAKKKTKKQKKRCFTTLRFALQHNELQYVYSVKKFNIACPPKTRIHLFSKSLPQRRSLCGIFRTSLFSFNVPLRSSSSSSSSSSPPPIMCCMLSSVYLRLTCQQRPPCFVFANCHPRCAEQLFGQQALEDTHAVSHIHTNSLCPNFVSQS